MPLTATQLALLPNTRSLLSRRSQGPQCCLVAAAAGGVPLTAAQLAMTQFAHFMVFPICLGTLFVACEMRHHVLHQRLRAPFLIVISNVCQQVALAAEIGHHHFVGNWELQVALTDMSDLVNGFFYAMLYGSQYLRALALRPRDSPFARWPRRSADVAHMLFDTLMLAAILATPVVYAAQGRCGAGKLSVKFASAASAGTVARMIRVLGVSPTLALVFWLMPMLGVLTFAAYKATLIEFLHFPLAIAFLCAEIAWGAALLSCGAAHSPPDVDCVSSSASS
eukprot:CAMPEP_0119360494 /NCGR_PEP_ID=MMETSP1334-20130426/8077_1 /TAXON_ID=127549 /ORGANISM="Calcidiscus leptoporus, Strain RCC1130" /LENGTH=279 /DNA_ID=CAMNT_0007375339 /DNA_START=206 /DNA_END=1045 /DNA_ORIENTATION=-